MFYSEPALDPDAEKLCEHVVWFIFMLISQVCHNWCANVN